MGQACQLDVLKTVVQSRRTLLRPPPLGDAVGKVGLSELSLLADALLRALLMLPVSENFRPVGLLGLWTSLPF